MDNHDFRRIAHEFVDWMADYYSNIQTYPVRSSVKPGEILAKLPVAPPESGEAIEQIFFDFQHTLMPGMTHWQHPQFYAYFPAQTSYPSILAAMLSATVSPQCMSWQTSPAATELEQCVTNWLRNMLGLPATFTGTIQEGATHSTLIGLVMAREKYSKYEVAKKGLYKQKRFTVYTSEHAHASVLKAVRIVGLGEENLRLISTKADFSIDETVLEDTIQKDVKKGAVPLAIIGVLGSTSSTAIDSLSALSRIAKKFNIWLHVDAAYAGTAMVLPELRWMIKGIERVDSLVVSPHKWMLTGLHCAVLFVRDVKNLEKSLAISSDYLKTKEDKQVVNYRDRSIGLGREFRALKLWFVIREYGVEGIRRMIRHHIALTNELKERIEHSDLFELLAPVTLNLLCFRALPRKKGCSEKQINALNQKLLEEINASGKLYLTSTILNGKYVLRLVVGQQLATHESVNAAWQLIVQHAEKLI